MPKKPIEITVTDLRNDLPRILSRIAILKESYLITNHGQPMGIMEPLDEDRTREILSR